MNLQELLKSLSDLEYDRNFSLDREVTGLAINAENCQPGNLFINISETKVSSGECWQSALDKGSIAALVSSEVFRESKLEIAELCPPYLIGVPDLVSACAKVAATFYDYPASKLQAIGVTGTNGKTTTSHLIEFFLDRMGYPTALIGTLYYRWQKYLETATRTTPFAINLQALLAKAVNAGCQYAVMEVSSAALSKRRTLGVPFKAAIFTNLSQDHLDYHQNMEDYFAAKALLFQPDLLKGLAIVNQDDIYGRRLLSQISPTKVWTYSLQEAKAEIYADRLSYNADGVRGFIYTPQGQSSFYSPLIGDYNVANLLGAIGTGLFLGLKLESMLEFLPQFTGVSGRMESVKVAPEQDINVVVDFAHTPAALESVLKAARKLISGKLICVFGCGGDRDPIKRPQMGKIAATLADWAIVTSDNPRTEEPQKIFQDILSGMPPNANFATIGDRAEAIKTAIIEAKPGDLILIAGKGHENYQVIGTDWIPFNDRDKAREALVLRV